MLKKFLIFSFILASALAFSYAQFNESLYIGSPTSPSTVSTGELDVGIWSWMGKPYKNYSRYMKIEPLLEHWGYENAVKTVEFNVSNAYPGAKTFCLVWVRNTGTIAAKVSKVEWDLPDYVSVTYYGGEIPDWVAEDAKEFVNELYENGKIDYDTYNEMIKTIDERVNSGCLHEGVVLDAEKNEILIFYWTFEDDTPENASFTGNCTIEFTQFNK